MRLIFLLSFFLVACGYDVNSDPNRRGKVDKGSLSYNADTSSSPFCQSSIVVSTVGLYEHQHTPKTLALSEVNKATGGTYRLLGGEHEHTFYLSAEHMGNLIRKREIIVLDREGHSHNLSLRCAN